MRNQNSIFWNVFFNQRRYYISAIIFALLGWLSTFTVPIIIKNLIDGVFAEKPLEIKGIPGYLVSLIGGKDVLADHLWIAALAILFFLCLTALFNHMTARLSGIACEKILRQLRNRLYAKFHELADSFFAKSPTGDLIQRCTSDVGKIQPFLSNQLLESGREVVMLAVLIPFMFVLDVKMALLSLLCIPFTVIVLYINIRLPQLASCR
jgi:ATP-binding cassette subfamily B protein